MPSSATVRAIYRCLLRDARALQRTPHFNVRRVLQLEQWGAGSFVEPLSKQEEEKVQTTQTKDPRVLTSLEQFYQLRDNAFRMGPPTVDVIQSVRAGFRENMQLSDPKAVSAKLDEAIEALSELSTQQLLAQCSSVTVTNGVRIEATSHYVQSHSNPASNTYRFTYRVTITNQNEECSVQILGRQYTFESEKGQRVALPRNSPGIVGATPLLAPGQTFEYASGVDIDAPRGSVTGCLHAVRKTKNREEDDDNDGELFDALVSKFALLAPDTPSKR
ncbi:ApaG domain [Phytophthora cinnamomi]|uniref:ApaG domain n=1 Tax=Phytophthora cinnamomi TaxID=4785 RepID=UPI00355A54A8|nr:ApaG domain [Phytophthora cinnamomi]